MCCLLKRGFGFVLTACILLIAAAMHPLFAAQSSDAQNGIVYFDEYVFAGWPANEGSWAWGDEILVSFNVGAYEERTDTHSIRGRPDRMFARSMDGGKTWAFEESHPRLSPRIPVPEDGVGDMTAPGFALKSRGNAFIVSFDKGHTWKGPYPIPDFPEQGAYPNARTSYIVTGPKSALLFMSSARFSPEGSDGERGRAYVMRTNDGCKTFQFLGWMSPDLELQASENERKHPVFSIMPSVVRIDGDHYVAALRQRIHKRKWTDVYESKDGGKTWTFLSKAEAGSNNPPALLKLADGKTLVLIYGFRGREPGLRAKLSRDNGKTWTEEFILRKDARTWDIGYPRAHLLPNGEVLALYYYTTKKHPQQHIAATCWAPPIAQNKAANAP